MSSPPPAGSQSEAEEVLDSIRLKGIKRVTTEFVRNARQSRAPKSQEGHIPRPMNAFILFTTISPEHELLQEHYPRRKELLRHLGVIWRSTDWKRRKPYQDVATELTNEHKRLYPDYMFKPRPRKNRDPTRAPKATPTGPLKGGHSFGTSNTQEKTPEAQKETHMWSTYSPSGSPRNLLECARVPAHRLMQAGSDRIPPDGISPTIVLDAIREETLVDQFLYRFYEELQSPSQIHYGVCHGYAGPPSPSNDAGTPDELWTPPMQDMSLANPKSTSRTASAISSILSTNPQPYADVKFSSRESRLSDVPPRTESDRNTVVSVDDSETHHASDGCCLPSHQDDNTISALPQSPPVHHAQPVLGRSTGDQTRWLDISGDPKSGDIQHLPFYRLFAYEQTTSDGTRYDDSIHVKHNSGESVRQDPLSWEEPMVLGQPGASCGPVMQRNGFSPSPGTERLHPMSLSTGTFDHIEYTTRPSDQYPYDHFPLAETSSGFTVHAEHFQSSQNRPDLYRYTLTHLPIGETSTPSHYVPGERAASCDASNMQ